MKRLYAIIVACIVIALLWSRGGTSIPILLLAMFWLFSGDWKEKGAQIKQHALHIAPFAIYFLVHVFAMLYTPDTASGWTDVSKKLNLFFLPFLLFSIGIYLAPYRKQMYQVFIATIILFFLVAVYLAIPQYKAGNQLAFFYVHLVSFSNMHPSYLAMYALLAIALCYDMAVRHSKIYLLPILPLFAFIVVLVARTELIILFVLLIFIWLYHFLKRKKYVIGIGGVALIVFVSVLSVWKIPELNARFFDVLTDKKQVKNTWSIKNERESIWDVAWDRIKQKPMLGVGTGAGAAILTEDFKKDGYILLAKKTSLNNVHNQFIQQWFILGILGLLSCLYLYANLFWQAYVSKSFILFVLSMILTIASLTECILESQSGIVFFVLFYAFFLVEQKEEPITNT